MGGKKSVEELLELISTYNGLERTKAIKAAEVMKYLMTYPDNGEAGVSLWSKGVLRTKGELDEVYIPLLSRILMKKGADYLHNESLIRAVRMRFPGGEALIDVSFKGKVGLKTVSADDDGINKYLVDFGEILFTATKEDLEAKVKQFKSRYSSAKGSFRDIFSDYVSTALKKKYNKDLMVFLQQEIKGNPLQVLLRRKGFPLLLSDKSISRENALKINYFAFSNRIIYSVEQALSTFPGYTEATNEKARIEFIRELITDSELMKKFGRRLPLTLDIRPTDPNGVFAPRHRASPFFALEYASRVSGKKWFKPEGSIHIWESGRKVWTFGRVSEELFYDMLDLEQNTYLIRGVITNPKLRHAITALFQKDKVSDAGRESGREYYKVNDANKAYMKERLKLSEDQLLKSYLLADITGNNILLLPSGDDANGKEGKKGKREKIVFHLQLLERLIEEANLDTRETDMLNKWLYAQRNGAESDVELSGRMEDLACIARNKIRLGAIGNYAKEFEDGKTVKSIESDEREKISINEPLILDNYYRIRLRYRIERSLNDAHTSIEEILKRNSSSLLYVSRYQKRLFDFSWQKMLEFAYGKGYETMSEAKD